MAGGASRRQAGAAYLYVRRGTVFAALIDPARQSYPGLSEQERVFYTTPENEPYLPQPFSAQVFPQTEGIAISAEDGRYYQLFSLPLSSIGGRVYYASPAEPFLQTLTPVQIVLLCVTTCLLLAIPLCWLVLRRLLLDPLTKMTGAMQAIQAGHTDERMPKDSRIEEVRETFETVNAMLDTISAQKINSYEQELEIQRTQMQCLQLQIRPHFFLNCLSMIYSLAGERKFAPHSGAHLGSFGLLPQHFQRRLTTHPARNRAEFGGKLHPPAADRHQAAAEAAD